MKLVINHQTHYCYESLVKQSNQYIRLTPQSRGHQRVNNWQLVTPGSGCTQQDGFGNIWTSLSVNQPHQELLIMAQGEVETSPVEGIMDQSLPPVFFTHTTETTHCHEPLRDFIARHGKGTTRAHLIDLSAAILEHMPYTPNSTTVDTTAAEAFDLAKGVCQDHTHVFLACARQLKLPARYVSGYLYSEDTTHVSTHAWAEVYLDGLWYCFDTSNQLFCLDQHVSLAFGRDYLDSAPVRGTRQGGGEESMQTLVRVLAA
ncbi:transglutaminase N-terminal domain-containing protein [Alkanindiges sp. WGS2144]|uniref:transglutaminase family protein n=1 Tax=Alkanindiges sp. WGS2144 TaxID=3366808 RepID=UPI003753D9A1